MSAFDATACALLSTVSKLCGVAGFFRPNTIAIIEAADVTSVAAPDAGTKTVSTDITLDATKFFFLWNTMENGAQISTNSVGQLGSQAFQNTITVPLAGVNRDDVLKAMDDSVNDSFVIIATDTNGNNLLLGTAQSPMRVTEGGVQAIIDGENNSCTITFQNTGPAPLVYTGAIVTS